MYSFFTKVIIAHITKFDTNVDDHYSDDFDAQSYGRANKIKHVPC